VAEHAVKQCSSTANAACCQLECAGVLSKARSHDPDHCTEQFSVDRMSAAP
jgi:hypothetical protein